MSAACKKCLFVFLFPAILFADIDRVTEDRTLPYWQDYILSGDPNQLDEYIQVLVKELEEIQDDIITTVNLGVDLDDTDVRYFGTMDSEGNYDDGDWRIIKVSSDDFEIQKLISSSWTEITKWSVANGLEMSGDITADEFIDGSYDSTDWNDAYDKRVDTWTLPLLFSSNTASISLSSSYIIVGNSSGVGTGVDMTGDVHIDNAGATTIQPDSVALTTDTTGNYVASITNGTSITGGDGGSEGAALTLDVADDSIDGTELADSITIDGTELDLSGDVEVTGQLKLSTSSAPGSANATGETGDVQWDSDYVYVCVAANTWKRAAISTWSTDSLLMESGDYILLENGDKILTE